MQQLTISQLFIFDSDSYLWNHVVIVVFPWFIVNVDLRHLTLGQYPDWGVGGAETATPADGHADQAAIGWRADDDDDGA